MRIRSTSDAAGTAHIALAGELDQDCVALLHDEVLSVLSRDRPRDIVVDLRLVTLADSTALGTLVSCHRAAAAAGATFSIANPSPFVRRVLWVSGLLGLFTRPADSDLSPAASGGAARSGSSAVAPRPA